MANTEKKLQKLGVNVTDNIGSLLEEVTTDVDSFIFLGMTRPNSHRTRDAMRMQIGMFFL